MTDHFWLWVALACYAASGVLTLQRLRAGVSQPLAQRLNQVAMAAGFVAHTIFMLERGHALARCPLTNLFEAQIFIAWGAVLFYLLIGPSYRLSFLGAFTAPVVLLICLAALLAARVIDVPQPHSRAGSPWVEFHAAVGSLAAGAFALSLVTSVMYLVQERQLKTRRLSRSFLLLPPIEQLDLINFRLVVLGFVLLTVGMVGGVLSYWVVGHWGLAKIIWANAAWLVYALWLVARTFHGWRGRRSARTTIAAFVLVLAFYWVAHLVGMTNGGGG